MTALRSACAQLLLVCAALRAVGEPMRGKPVSELSVGMMLDGLFAITRDFDMQTQPHLLLLQKTMVMVEGVATSLDPGINMWDTAAPFVREWIRTELGPEAAAADAIRRNVQTLGLIPDLIRRLDDTLPNKGGAPPPPPLPEIKLIWDRDRPRGAGLRYVATALVAAAAALGAGRGLRGRLLDPGGLRPGPLWKHLWNRRERARGDGERFSHLRGESVHDAQSSACGRHCARARKVPNRRGGPQSLNCYLRSAEPF